jgi:hypothetical protein
MIRDYQSAEDVVRHIDEVLAKNGLLEGMTEATTQRSPFDALVEKEEAGYGLDDPEERFALRLEGFRACIFHLTEDGVHPLAILKRTYATLKAVRPDLLNDMSMADIAVLCGDKGRATVSARVQVVYSKKVAAASRAQAKASCQKSAVGRAAMAEAAKGNSNRAKGARRAKL